MASTTTNPTWDPSAASTVGHVLAALLGLKSIADGVISYLAHMPGLLVVTTLVLGGALLGLAWPSWRHRARAAWAFLISICSVLAVVTIFGAPKVAHLGLPLPLVVVVPVLYITTVSLLAICSIEYGGTNAAAK